MTAAGDGVERLAPVGAILRPGELRFATVGLAHGHAWNLARELTALGAEPAWVHDDDAAQVERFRGEFPGARVARTRDEALDDPTVALVVTAAVPSARAALAIAAFEHGKDVVAAKPGFTALDQLAPVRAALARTGRRLWIYFGERLHSESAMHAEVLIGRGAIGRVVQVLGLGPHRIGAPRAPWFYRRADYGGILADLGSHQCEQFLAFTASADAAVAHAAVANHAHPEHPELQDYGEAALVAANGARGTFRVDWLSPAGLGTWGDVRTVLLGTDGYIELRKTIDLAGSRDGEHLLIADRDGERRLDVRGRVGCPFFARMVRDCLDRTDTALTEQRMCAASELALRAQAHAERAALVRTPE